MSKKVLIISTSMRKNSNSATLAEAFAKGAKEAGHDVELISLIGREINFCVGCLSCQTNSKCVIDDDVNLIMEKVLHADVVVYATPIYYYEMSGQMKTLLDRMNPLYRLDYAFRDVYLLTAATEDEPNVPDRAITGLGGWIECYPKSRFAGSVFAGGVTNPGEAKEHPAVQQAYEMGKKV